MPERTRPGYGTIVALIAGSLLIPSTLGNIYYREQIREEKAKRINLERQLSQIELEAISKVNYLKENWKLDMEEWKLRPDSQPADKYSK